MFKFVLANLTRGNLILCFYFILNENVNTTNEGKIKFVYQKADFTSSSSFISNFDWMEIFEHKNVKEMCSLLFPKYLSFQSGLTKVLNQL